MKRPPQSDTSGIGRRLTLTAAWIALGWVMLLHGLGSVGLIGPDEPRYAAVAAEMLARHDWVVPRLNGQPWLEKPVLLYWLAALGQAAGGVGAAAARLPEALLALALSGLLGLFLARLHSARAGWLAAFFSLTTAFWCGFGRAASTDMPLTATLAMTLMALFLWMESGKRRWLAAAAAALGLATLAKGPVAVVLAGTTYITFALWQRRRLLPRPADGLLALAVFLAVAAPWYAAVSLRAPAFPREFFLQQNLERFATNRYQHPQPFWYYLPIVALAALPWNLWLVAPALKEIRAGASGFFKRWRDRNFKFYLSLWAVAPVVFFSLSRSKLAGYVLPAVPALVALAAIAAAERWPAARWGRWLSYAGTGAMAALMLAATSPPADRMLDAKFSARPLARQLEAECHAPAARVADFARAPAALVCNGAPVYQWRLGRALDFGVGYSLHVTLPDYVGGAGTPARVLMPRNALPAFEAMTPEARVVASGPEWIEVAVDPGASPGALAAHR